MSAVTSVSACHLFVSKAPCIRPNAHKVSIAADQAHDSSDANAVQQRGWVMDAAAALSIWHQCRLCLHLAQSYGLQHAVLMWAVDELDRMPGAAHSVRDLYSGGWLMMVRCSGNASYVFWKWVGALGILGGSVRRKSTTIRRAPALTGSGRTLARRTG